MELAQFCSTSRVIIVAGKGGVGKTTVTATLAVAAARTGMSVLIVEVEGKSGLAAAFDSPALDYEERDLAPNVRGRTLTPDAALVDWLQNNGLKRVSKRLVQTGALDVVATAVPGMKDILVLGKVKSLDVQGAADLIIVDAPAAGHAITFLTSAQGLLDAVSVGPVRKQATDVVELLSDPERCRVLLVTIPEETPVSELVDTAFAIEDKTGVSLGPVVVNGCYDDLGLVPANVVSDVHAGTDATTAASIQRDAELLDVFVSDREAHDLARAAAFRAERSAIQRHQADRLGRQLPLPQIRLPFLFTADIGRHEIDRLADAFTASVGEL
ncbi:MAG TPA: ArsA-related P-loop ATPase [Acidimicrobiia bacterium]|jgi:anion-transporting  ArsA/GET3 family ATPase